MQQTANYKLNLIETNDPFSPEALNENARKMESALDAEKAARETTLAAEKATRETALAAEKTRVNGEIARVDAALAAEKTRVDAALTAKANQTALTALTQTVTANKSAADAALAAKANQTALTALTQTVTANKSAADAALNAKAAQTALTALTTRVGTLEQGRLRYKFGSYTGTGLSGNNKNRLAFDFKPLVLFVFGGGFYGGYPWFRNALFGKVDDSNSVFLTWEEQAVSWNASKPIFQLNEQNTSYDYLALGIQA